MPQVATGSRVKVRDFLLVIAPAVPGLVLAVIAIPLHYTADFGLAYNGGVQAWATGHPQFVPNWTGTPLLAVVMALVSRAAGDDAAARTFMSLNLVLWMVLCVVVWRRLLAHVSRNWWWATLIAAGIFAPAVSTIFWLQFNLVAFVLAIAGFVLIRRNATWAGALMGLGLAFKPIAILLPLALLLHRRSRRAGLWAIATVAVVSELSLAFLAWRAADPRALNPFAYLLGFLRNSHQWWACTYENYSPVATMCRLGLDWSTPAIVTIAIAILTAGWLLVRHLADTPQGDWELFAAGCFLSIMVGPIAWAHYGLLMAPLFLVLAYQFWRYHAPRSLWLGLSLSFALAELGWDPLSSIAGMSMTQEVVVYTVGQFSQYFLLLTWMRWRMALQRDVVPVASRSLVPYTPRNPS